MKKIFLLASFLIFSASANAADLKIGVVNMNRLNEAPQVEAINKLLQDRFSQPRDELKKMHDELQDEEKEIKRNELLMTESKLKKSKESLIGKIKEFREKEAKLANEIQAVQNQELAVFRDVVRNVLTDMAKTDKYDLILSDGIMYVDPKHDITDKILGRLKKEAKQ
ncbi:MAG TPA: OmpH family outer membrane protein [Gammaproteobacteria bacterium]